VFKNIRENDGVEFPIVERQWLGQFAFEIEELGIMLGVFPIDTNGICNIVLVQTEERSLAASQIEESSCGMTWNGIVVNAAIRSADNREPIPISFVSLDPMSFPWLSANLLGLQAILFFMC